MIQLFVEPYCATCPEFEPYVTKDDEVITMVNPSYLEGGTVERHLCDTRIYCEHRGRCNSIYTHAKENVKKGE